MIYLSAEVGMPQISLYIDELTMKRIENAAKEQHVSISGWVARQLRARLEAIYPPRFEELFGSVVDKTFRRPESLAFREDVPRESL
jgi:hypothetical protein